MAQQVNWGVLDAASIAVQRAIPAMREAPSATFLALASRDESKARTVASKLRTIEAIFAAARDGSWQALVH